MSERVSVTDLRVSIADGIHDGTGNLVGVLGDLLDVLQEDDRGETMVRLRRHLVYRTAERLYCQRLAVLASLAPATHPDPTVLRELAQHCWLAADLLALMDPEHPERRRDGDALVDLGVPAASHRATPPDHSTATPQGSDSTGLDGDARDW